MYIVSHADLSAVARQVRRCAILARRPLNVYSKDESPDVYVTLDERPEMNLIGRYTENAPVQWVLDDLAHHVRAIGAQLV